ncbi:MAG: apolipoprotein N-acyltransferase [Deltaproteobacteria bacterium]|nr:apolipoprotein N-acyltransferase [Deltaproteobacteria bacterium]
MLAAAFPPVDWWPLCLVAVAPFILMAQRLSPRRALIAGWLGGLTMFTGLMYWILVVMTVYGGLNWVLAGLALFFFAFYLGSYLGVFCCIVSFANRGGISPLLVAPVAWAGLEWIRNWAFTGVPWLPLSMGLDGSLPLMQSAELWSTTGLSLLVVLVNALIAEAVRLPWGSAPVWRRGAALVLGLALVAGGWVWGSGRLEQVQAAAKAAPKLPVSVVQGDVSLPMLWQKSLRPVVVERHVKATKRLAQTMTKRPWLVVWPESAAPFYFMRDARESLPVLNLAKELDAYIMLGSLGAVEVGDKYKVSNRSWLVGPDGLAAGYYDKVHLVPFGEYVPWSQILFFVRAVAQIGVDFAVGQPGKVVRMGSLALGPLICYESIFPELARDMRLSGARLLVNQTNDAWFGRTSAPYQHMAHLRFRAVENRLACARAANTGVSGFVLPSGKVIKPTVLFRPAVVSANLPLMNEDTFYLRYGEIAGPGALGLTVLFILWVLWQERKREV